MCVGGEGFRSFVAMCPGQTGRQNQPWRQPCPLHWRGRGRKSRPLALHRMRADISHEVGGSSLCACLMFISHVTKAAGLQQWQRFPPPWHKATLPKVCGLSLLGAEVVVSQAISSTGLLLVVRMANLRPMCHGSLKLSFIKWVQNIAASYTNKAQNQGGMTLVWKESHHGIL